MGVFVVPAQILIFVTTLLFLAWLCVSTPFGVEAWRSWFLRRYSNSVLSLTFRLLHVMCVPGCQGPREDNGDGTSSPATNISRPTTADADGAKPSLSVGGLVDGQQVRVTRTDAFHTCTCRYGLQLSAVCVWLCTHSCLPFAVVVARWACSWRRSRACRA